MSDCLFKPAPLSLLVLSKSSSSRVCFTEVTTGANWVNFFLLPTTLEDCGFEMESRGSSNSTVLKMTVEGVDLSNENLLKSDGLEVQLLMVLELLAVSSLLRWIRLSSFCLTRLRHWRTHAHVLHILCQCQRKQFNVGLHYKCVRNTKYTASQTHMTGQQYNVLMYMPLITWTKAWHSTD